VVFLGAWALLVVHLATRERPTREAALLGLGDLVPALDVVDLDGRAVRIAGAHAAGPTVIWFWSATCRCVRECEERIHAFRAEYEPRGVRFVAVDANDNDEPADIHALLARLGSTYTVHRDLGAIEAVRLGIEASASVVVLDAAGHLRYRGAIDDDLRRPQVSYLRQAVDAVLAGREVDPQEVPSYGCYYPIP
jgi:hypothetical protein